jgi:4-hydroxy-tetrahydrodipicolinate reductase
MINVCFAGITGWTAPPILRAIGEAADLMLTAGVSRSAVGQSLGDVGAPGAGLVYASVTEALDAAEVDVLVDYTSADAVKANAQAAVDAGVTSWSVPAA